MVAGRLAPSTPGTDARGHDTQLVAHVDQIVVAGPPEDLHRVLVGGPQFVVTGHPDHLGEPSPQQVQRPADLVGALGDVAAHDQPVVRRRRIQRFGDGFVAQVAGVQIRYRPQGRLPCGRGRLLPRFLPSHDSQA